MREKTMTEFTGKINRIVFENDQDLYKILDVAIIGKLEKYDREDIKVTGSFGDVQVGATYTCLLYTSPSPRDS